MYIVTLATNTTACKLILCMYSMPGRMLWMPCNYCVSRHADCTCSNYSDNVIFRNSWIICCACLWLLVAMLWKHWYYCISWNCEVLRMPVIRCCTLRQLRERAVYSCRAVHEIAKKKLEVTYLVPNFRKNRFFVTRKEFWINSHLRST